MYQFCPPKFKFGLFVVDNSKTYFHKGQQNQNASYAPVICYADTYEIKEDGSIVFYQTIQTQDSKRFKVPVLSYPSGKWDACVLLDDSNEFPVFKGYARQNNQQNFNAQPDSNQNSSNSSSSDEEYGSQSTDTTTDELTQLNDNFAQSVDNKVYLTSPVQHNQHQTMPMQPYGANTGLGMPGITNTNNPQEFKKQKEDWLENEIKQYTKDIALFTIPEFLTSISKKPQNKTYKISESDVVWASSKLIRNKAIISRKFAEPNMQKTLSLILPDIMKRQWDGKMAPILQILQEKEETKNTTAIDLAVWMVQNNY
jgi:hypothetical protein